jgi:hypothetical protein
VSSDSIFVGTIGSTGTARVRDVGPGTCAEACVGAAMVNVRGSAKKASAGRREPRMSVSLSRPGWQGCGPFYATGSGGARITMGDR